MKDLKLINGDIQLNRDLTVVSDDNELNQSIELLLSTYLGEFKYEPDYGVDYLTNGFKMYTNDNVQGLKLAIQRAFEQEPRIQQVLDVQTEFVERKLIIRLTLQKNNGDLLEREVGIDV